MNTHFEKPQGSYISFFSNLVKAKGGINLAQGIPGFQPPSQLLDCMTDVIKENVHQYAPGVGNFNLIDAINTHYSQKYTVCKDNFLIVQGATEALSLIYIYLRKIIGESFAVLSFNPAYECYRQLPAIFGQPFIDYTLNSEYSFLADDVEKYVKENNVRIIFISSPGNPYGKVWSSEEVERLIEIANRNSVYLIFDAVYNELYFGNPPFIPLNNLSPNVFYVNSFSKMLCITGWRIGYLYTHELHRNGIRAVHDYTGLCAPSIQQEALSHYLSSNNFGQDFVAQFRTNVKHNFLMVSQCLKDLDFFIPPIDGGCFIWAKLPDSYSDGFEFAIELYNSKGVAVIPGEHFSPNHISWIRLNLARPIDELKRASEHIADFINKK